MITLLKLYGFKSVSTALCIENIMGMSILLIVVLQQAQDMLYDYGSSSKVQKYSILHYKAEPFYLPE